MAKKEVDTNSMGMRGESIFMSRILQGYVFTGSFLGDKAPIVDFYMEIKDPKTPFQFLIQVKSTEQGYDDKGRLKIQVPATKYKQLQKRFCPTYVAGVDVNSETVYLCSAFQKDKKITSLPTKHRLKFSSPKASQKTIELLKQDVIRFYSSPVSVEYKNNFKSNL